MKYGYKAVSYILLIGFLSGLFSGCRRGGIMDGDGMVNKIGLMLDALQGAWASDDGKWSAQAEDYSIIILFGGTTALDGTFTFTFESYDTDVKTELVLSSGELRCGEDLIGSAEQLYTEGGKLYMAVLYPDGMSETVVFVKTAEKTEVLDGYNTYVDNDVLMPIITGVWKSRDGQYAMSLTDSCDISLTSDGETVLVGRFDFTYLMPRNPDDDDSTELRVEPRKLTYGDGTVYSEIESLRFETDDTGNCMVLELFQADESSTAVRLYSSDNK